MINRKIDAMLFDFDGTLADTSYDMIYSLNILLEKHKIKNVELSDAKNYISRGANGLISFSCPNISDDEKQILIQEYLDIYEKNLFIKTHLFKGVSEIIDSLVKKIINGVLLQINQVFLCFLLLRCLI